MAQTGTEAGFLENQALIDEYETRLANIRQRLREATTLAGVIAAVDSLTLVVNDLANELRQSRPFRADRQTSGQQDAS